MSRADKYAARDETVAALAEVFRSRGFQGTSIGHIVTATGLGRGSLYHMFPGGKEEMARAVLDHVNAWFERNIFLPLEQDAPGPALAQMFDAVRDYFREGGRICLVGAFALDQTRDRFARRVQSYFIRWIKALRGCLERLGMPAPEAGVAASQVVTLIQGGIVLTRATSDPDHFQTALEAARLSCMV